MELQALNIMAPWYLFDATKANIGNITRVSAFPQRWEIYVDKTITDIDSSVYVLIASMLGYKSS
jgi:hypothetical protein